MVKTKKNKYVDFVSDEHFLECVKYVCTGYFETKEDLSIDDLKDNGLDPFKIIFDIVNRGVSFDDWLKNEENRQLDKTLNNRIGEFHQKLLGGVKGWKDLGTGDDTKLDLIKEDKTIAIELKNKFNTTNSDSLDKVRDKIEKFIEENPISVGYWAYIIEKDNSSGEKVWRKKSRILDPRIKVAWGSRVYEIVTGDSNALKKTWEALPKAIKDSFSKEISEEDMIKLTETFSSAF